MKKVLLLILVLALTLAFATPALAADITPEGDATGTTTVTHEVATSYTVTIPATVNFTDGASVSLAANHVLPVGKTLYFAINGGANSAGDPAARNVKDTTSNKTYAYTIKDGGNTIAIDGKVALKATTVDTADSAEVTKALTFALADGVTIGLAGTYTDTLTFTVSLDDTVAP